MSVDCPFLDRATTKNRVLLTFRVHEMDDRLILEDVDLFDPRDDVNAKSLQRALQPLVVRCRRLVDGFLLSDNDAHEGFNERIQKLKERITERSIEYEPPDAALPTSAHGTGHLHQLLPIHLLAMQCHKKPVINQTKDKYNSTN